MPSIDGSRITDHWGKQSWRRSPSNPEGWHYGLDIAGRKPGDRTAILNVADGVVVSIASDTIPYRSGRHVKVRHPDGSATVHNHISNPVVKVGDKVKRGQKLATMSNTGNVTGVHDHLEWWKDSDNHNSHFDPLDRLSDYGWNFGRGRIGDTLTDDWAGRSTATEYGTRNTNSGKVETMSKENVIAGLEEFKVDYFNHATGKLQKVSLSDSVEFLSMGISNVRKVQAKHGATLAGLEVVIRDFGREIGEDYGSLVDEVHRAVAAYIPDEVTIPLEKK